MTNIHDGRTGIAPKSLRIVKSANANINRTYPYTKNRQGHNDTRNYILDPLPSKRIGRTNYLDI